MRIGELSRRTGVSERLATVIASAPPDFAALRAPNNHPPSSGRMPVLMEGAAESVSSEDIEPHDPCRGDRIRKRMK
jgi:hypothetical protein